MELLTNIIGIAVPVVFMTLVVGPIFVCVLLLMRGY